MEDKQLTLVDHLAELRKRIIIIIISIVLGSFIAYNYIETIIDYMTKPARNLEFIYLSPSELFLAYIKVAIGVGIIISLPISLTQIWLFIKPGLKKNERKYLLIALFIGIIFFLIGCVFVYFVVIPMTLDFFVQFSVANIAPLFSFDNYLGFFFSLVISFGVVFELPLFVILLTSMNLVTALALRKYRKIVIIMIFIIAAILTPPDVVSQTMLAFPMVFLYEISIWIAAAIGRSKGKNNQIQN